MYGCSTRLGSEGEEEEEAEEEAEALGALPPAAALLSLRVSHCSVSHEMRTCSHTLALVELRWGTLQHADTHLRSSGEQARPRCFWSHLFFSPSCLCQVHTLLAVTSMDYKIKEGKEGGKEGADRGHVSEWRKMSLHHVVS